MNFSGYLDAISSNSETVKLAMELLLPFYSAGADFAWTFGPWLALFAIAWGAMKAGTGQGRAADIAHPFGVAIIAGICLVPVSPSVSGLSGTFGLGPYLTYSVSQSFNAMLQNKVAETQNMLTKGEPVPISALGVMNRQYSDAFAGTDLKPLLDDYWGNCTTGVVTFENELTPAHWRSVGLLGPGGLGLTEDEISAPDKYLESVLDELGGRVEGADAEGWSSIFDWDNTGLNSPSWDDLREEVLPILRKKVFPAGTGRAYKVPTRYFWKRKFTEDTANPNNEPYYMKVGNPGAMTSERALFMSVDDWAYWARTAQTPPDWDPNKFYARNCKSLFLLSHNALREFYIGMRDEFEVPLGEGPDSFADFEKTSSVAAFTNSIMTLYNNSAAKRKNDAVGSLPSNGLAPQDDFVNKAFSYISAGAQGATNAVASFFLGLQLDQWVLSFIGTLALAIAFLLVFFPFFLPYAFISPQGENAISVVFKVIIMLQITLSFAYIIVSIGAMIMSVVNAYAASELSNGGISTNTTAGLVVALNLGCLVFPTYAGRLAYLMLFGSNGVSAPQGQPISAGKQAGITAAAGFLAGRALQGLGKALSSRRDVGTGTGTSETKHRPFGGPAGGDGANGSGPQGPRLPSGSGGSPQQFLPTARGTSNYPSSPSSSSVRSPTVAPGNRLGRPQPRLTNGSDRGSNSRNNGSVERPRNGGGNTIEGDFKRIDDHKGNKGPDGGGDE